jgi:hypothetical protein
MNKQQTAKTFITSKAGACHNAKTDGTEYRLHGHVIARKDGGNIVFNWCGWYTPTTASHMNAILKELPGCIIRVSYAKARDTGETTFTVM